MKILKNFLAENLFGKRGPQLKTIKEKDFVKNICMIDSHRNLIVAIVKGEDKASTKNCTNPEY